MDASHSLPSVESTLQPRDGTCVGPEPPARPHSTSRDERAGRHANKRSRAISV
jgi:hypothetical protein